MGADLQQANLEDADLFGANLYGAVLCGAVLEGAILVRTDLRDARLTGSRVYGASAWDIKTNERTQQQSLIITDRGERTQRQNPIITDRSEPVITVDNLEVAQFIYLLLNNQHIRKAIDTITSKAVLILGRFSEEERKSLLEALREELRKHDSLPIMFDRLELL
jgi:uncharacterized protein YjbI with pentapeptide repeats